jgi:preprotein translocase subunit YajC
VLFGGIAIVFYFFMIRPQQKKQKDQKKFIEELKKGDMVVTVGGIHGKIVDQNDVSVTLDIDRGTKIKFEKSSISLESSKQYR